MMNSTGISADMQEFRSAIKKLSDKIGRAASLWNDAKFAELSASVGVVATQSKDLMVSGERCCTAIEKFNKIAAEKI